jgi:hypothetical protein
MGAEFGIGGSAGKAATVVYLERNSERAGLQRIET